MYSTDFPINLLRNIIISTVRTSHFLVIDMDIMVSSRELLCLFHGSESPQRNRTDSCTADARREECDHLTRCVFGKVQDFEEMQLLHKLHTTVGLAGKLDCRGIQNAPETKKDVSRCIADKKCFLHKTKIRTHVPVRF